MPPIMPNYVNIMPEYGHLDIRNSTVSYMGFPLGGFSEVGSTRAAIMFHDSSNFAIANSTIAFNFDEIYARNIAVTSRSQSMRSMPTPAPG